MKAGGSVGRKHTRNLLRWLESLFLLAGILALGFCAVVYIDTGLYQSYEEWSFDRSLRGEPASIRGYITHWFRESPPEHPVEVPRAEPPVAQEPPPPPKPLVGRLEIPSINLSAIVLEGVDSHTLRRAVGHIPGTALPGQPGNFAVAGHRDTFFRGLRNIHKNDAILFTTLDGSYRYAVDSIVVVGPSNTAVLKPTRQPTMTLVTCFPFSYIGSAPRRFVVIARQVASTTVL
jgi:LPXTG-site transpeptidase (sortase) family protein